MSAGEVLDRAFVVYRGHFFTLFVTALVFVPVGFVYGALGYAPAAAFAGQDLVAALSVSALMVVATVLSWAALTWQVHRAVAGGEVSVVEGYRRAFRAAPALFALWAILYALFVVMLFVGAVPGGIIVIAGAAIEGGMSVAASAFGLALMLGVLCAAGIWWTAVATMATPSLVVEGTGILASISRARDLAAGARVRIGALISLGWLIVMLPTLGGLFLLGTASTVWDPDAAAQLTTTQLYVQQFVTFGIGAATSPFLVAVMVMLYYDRRVRREGLDVEIASRGLTGR